MSKNDRHDEDEVFMQLAHDFHELVSNKEELRASLTNFLDNTIDELSLGIIFDLHRKYKTDAYEIANGQVDDDDEEAEDFEIIAQQDLKKTQKCLCSICGRVVVANRFAQHLGACMGMGRNRFRNATRSVTNSSNNKDRENLSFSSVPSDDEDDIDWNSGNKRVKKKKRSNGNSNKKPKVGGGTPKKNNGTKLIDAPSTIKIEADDEELSKEILQDHSNSSSPSNSLSSIQSSQSSSKKKDKSKSKKSKRDRSSPNTSISAD